MKLKYIFLMGIASLILSCLYGSWVFAQSLEPQNDLYSTDATPEIYTDTTLGISMELPSGWETEHVKDGLKLVREQNVVSIDIRLNKFGSSHTDLTQYAIEDLNERKNGRQDFRLLNSEQAMLSDVPAYKAIYTFVRSEINKGQTDKILRFWVSDDSDKVYTIAYVAAIDKYEQYLPEAQRIINSFEIGYLTTESDVNSEQQFQNLSLPISSDEYFTYQSESLRVKLDYPALWEKQEVNGGIRFISASEDNSDTFRETFEVSVYPMGSLPFLPSGNLSVNDVTNGFVKYYNETLPNLEILDSEATLVDANNARLLGIKYSDQNTGETQAMNLFTTNANDIYVISYYAQPATYPLYLPMITKMVLSMQILPVTN